MERFFAQARAELGLQHETTLQALASLCDWLDRYVAADHTEKLVGRARGTRRANQPSLGRLIDRTLDAIDSPFREDVSLAMALRGDGLSLDQVDAFVQLFLAHLQVEAVEGYTRSAHRLNDWLDRGDQGDRHALPN